MAEDGRFKPGHPGGPGRPRAKPFLDWCKKWTVESAEKFLRPIAEEPGKNQLEAIKTIMAYGVGKPVESVESTHSLEGLGADPTDAKELLGQLIAGATAGSPCISAGHGGSEDNKPSPLLDTERGPGEGNL